MNAQFGLTVILYAFGVALVCGAYAVSGTVRPRTVLAALVMVQLSVVVQAVVDAALVLRAHHGGALATHVGYLITSLIILPVVAAAIHLDSGRWGSAAIAFGCVLVAVVSLRLHQTLGTPRA